MAARMLVVAAVVLIAVMAGFAFAYDVMVYEPVAKAVGNGGTVELGTVGPGQSVSLVVEPNVREGGTHGVGGRWDQVVFTSLPDGWKGEPSLVYGNPMKAIVKVAPDAGDGEYRIGVKVIDEPPGEGLGDVEFDAVVRVSREVLKTEVWPTQASAGAGQPAGYYVKIKNEGVASDVFKISSEGVPLWHYEKTVFVPRNSERVIKYEIVGEEENEYSAKIIVESVSSARMREETAVSMSVNSNLFSDYLAAGHGLLIFPVIEQPVYGLLGFIANLLAK